MFLNPPLFLPTCSHNVCYSLRFEGREEFVKLLTPQNQAPINHDDNCDDDDNINDYENIKMTKNQTNVNCEVLLVKI